VEAFLSWLIGSLGWDGLKKLFRRGKASDIKLLKQALDDAQDRSRELIKDRELMMRLVEQRNRLGAELTQARGLIAELEAEWVELRKAHGGGA